MIIDCISDTHGHLPPLEGGDLLIVAGDYSFTQTYDEHLAFIDWLRRQEYTKKVFIGGNHDRRLLAHSQEAFYKIESEEIVYLQDYGTEFESLKIWGSPWTKSFEGMNPHCKAFTLDTEEELAEKWALIPKDIDILITHSPPYGVRDMVVIGHKMECVGSRSLQIRSLRLDLQLWVVGHIHEGYGVEPPGGIIGGQNCKLLNASHVNEHYKPVNKPIRVIL